MIDGARVLWWAWAGEVPFGACGGTPIFGFAICEYDSGSIYRFSCDENWKTINDSQHTRVDGAKAAMPRNYLASANTVQWHAARG